MHVGNCESGTDWQGLRAVPVSPSRLFTEGTPQRRTAKSEPASNCGHCGGKGQGTGGLLSSCRSHYCLLSPPWSSLSTHTHTRMGPTYNILENVTVLPRTPWKGREVMPLSTSLPKVPINLTHPFPLISVSTFFLSSLYKQLRSHGPLASTSLLL